MIRLFALLLSIALTSCSPAYALPFCAPRTEIAERLWAQYREELYIAGVTLDGALMEVFTSENGTWTTLITTADGMSCMFSAGNDWMEFPPMPKGDPT